MSLFCPAAEAFLLTASSFAFPSLSLELWGSEGFLDVLSEGDWGWLLVGVLGPLSGGGDGGRPFLRLLFFGLG